MNKCAKFIKMSSMVEKSVHVGKAIHARPAMMIVELANTFLSQVWLRKGELTVNAKSVLGVLMLAAAEGDTLQVVASGPDEEKAVDTICNFLENLEVE